MYLRFKIKIQRFNVLLATDFWLLAASTKDVITDLIRNLLNIKSCQKPAAMSQRLIPLQNCEIFARWRNKYALFPLFLIYPT